MPRNPPVYQCDRGHMLCNECHGKLNNCPVCRVPLGKTRSLITEKVIAYSTITKTLTLPYF